MSGRTSPTQTRILSGKCKCLKLRRKVHLSSLGIDRSDLLDHWDWRADHYLLYRHVCLMVKPRMFTANVAHARNIAFLEADACRFYSERAVHRALTVVIEYLREAAKGKRWPLILYRKDNFAFFSCPCKSVSFSMATGNYIITCA